MMLFFIVDDASDIGGVAVHDVAHVADVLLLLLQQLMLLLLLF